ncbi:MAG: L,D-transpeptidase family protein [Mobilitalea sp.]
MNKPNIKKFFNCESLGNKTIIIALIILVYLLISLFFSNHFFFHTEINGVNLSLRAYDDADYIIRNYIKNYELQLLERNGETEFITRNDIELQYNEKNSITEIYEEQNSFQWISSLFKHQNYYVTDLYKYHKEKLEDTINGLMCINKDRLEPQNVSFKYSKGTYKVITEVYGNKIIKDKLNDEIKINLLKGKTSLDLDLKLCYENPEYILSSDKTLQTKNLLNKYIATKIIYCFGNKIEILDGNIISKWLIVDENLDIIINKDAVMNYVKMLSRKYDTVGASRDFRSSISKIIEVKGGLYGWKINQEEETKVLLENIMLGKVIKKEPIYTQKALSRDGNEIGKTYVEINITRQYLWFYKDGNLIAKGAVVTGNPNKGNATVVGTYMLGYKQKGATLIGLGYEVDVSYWMPFYGNMGIHDATWRNSFGGEIYKTRGTHGCVNVSFYLAKLIYENIDAGIPIISYEE